MEHENRFPGPHRRNPHFGPVFHIDAHCNSRIYWFVPHQANIFLDHLPSLRRALMVSPTMAVMLGVEQVAEARITWPPSTYNLGTKFSNQK
jgi:hypothetical protein